MTRHTPAISPRRAPEVLPEFLAHPIKRGCRECRMLGAPAASRAIKGKTHAHSQGSPKSCRHSLRNGFTVAPCSPWCTGLFSHHRLRKLLSANLTPASGCQDHTAWPSARLLPVSQRPRVHRTCPTFATLANAPLIGTGWGLL